MVQTQDKKTAGQLWIRDLLIAGAMTALFFVVTGIWQMIAGNPQPTTVENSSYMSYLHRSEERHHEMGELQERFFALQRAQFEDDVTHNAPTALSPYDDGLEEWILSGEYND